jgi:hypothetical protein
MHDSVSSPDSTSGTTDSVQFHDQLRSPDGGDAELSPGEIAHLFAGASEDVAETSETISRRGDALAAASHSLAEVFDGDLDDLERERVDALVTEAIEGLADVERWASDLHAILVAAEEARARLDERDGGE